MMYLRPDAGSLKQWADSVGDQSYTFDNMLPYFKKSITFTPPDSTRAPNNLARFRAEAFESSGGPVHVSYPKCVRPFSTYLEQAFNEIGIPTTEDFNSGSLLGAQFCSLTINPNTALRSSAQTAFLESCQARPNIKLFRNSLAKKIVFDGNKNAVGVNIDTEFSPLFLKAKKEVILSAGAFQSPQLLMVSGVGPAETLRKFDIPIIADRPGVGQNLADHVMFGPSYRVQPETLPTVLSDPARMIPALNDYFRNAEGALTNPGSDFVAQEKIPRDMVSQNAADALSELPESWPDVEYMSIDAHIGNYATPMFGTPLDGFNYAGILVSPTAPRSRGSVTITSADASELPIIDPNWFSDPIDVEVAIAGYKRARAVFATNAIQNILVDKNEFFPGPDVQADKLPDTLRNTVTTMFHASTTCRMGKKDDPMAVVDARAKVFGVSSLRVVDTSSFALLPPGHPQSMVYAFAEKIADAIKNGE